MTVACDSVRQIQRRTWAMLLALAAVLSCVVSTAPSASAHNRDWLRPDATGFCEWDPVAYWVQRCDVWSEATQANITVQIRPASNGGNAGFYLLDGLRATNWSNAWLTEVNAAAIYENTNITLVMPIGGAASFYADWVGPATYNLDHPITYKWETFLSQELPLYLQQHFGVAPNNNAIAGLSMGGTAAINLAAKHSEQFRMALSFSGYLTTTLPGAQTLLRIALLDAGGFNLNAMYGSILSSSRFDNDPFLNMSGLGDMPVYVSVGSGFPGPEDANIPVKHKLPGIALEIISNLSTRLWALKAVGAGLNVTQYYAPSGIHNWNRFGSELVRTRNMVLDEMQAW